MSMRTAREGEMNGVWWPVVVYKTTAATQEPLVFTAQDRLADHP
jgi:hypothetical protein